MENNKKYGSKERLFEMMYRVNSKELLKESLLTTDVKNEIIKDFINYCDKEIGLNGKLPEITIVSEEGVAKKNKSFGGYYPYYKKIEVVGVNRNLADVLRSLAHELVHHKQMLDNRIGDDSGETGSDIENEANSVAGVIMRNYGKINSDIYE